MAGMSTYIVLQLVDMLFVGWIGTTALAAVGTSVFISFLFLGLCGGVSIAVQATTSRLAGEGESDDLGRYLRTALVLVALFTPALAMPLVWLAPDILGLMTDDPAVVRLGGDYLRWMFASGICFSFSSAFMGFWSATERAGLYLRVVLCQAIVNVPANYTFMFGAGVIPAFGVTGAGMATFLAATTGFALHVWLARRHAQGSLRGPVGKYMTVLVRLMIPSGLQQFFDSLALTLMFRIVAWIGTVEVAAYSVLVNLVSAVALPAWGLGLAGATLVGQAMGAKSPDAANRWAWDVTKIGVLALVVLGIPFWWVPELILGVFIHEPQTLEIAVLPCRILGLMIGINGAGFILASILNGAGDVKRVMYVNLATQYVVLLPGAYLLGVESGLGLIGVWLAHQLGFRALNTLLLAMLWQQGRWRRIEL